MPLDKQKLANKRYKRAVKRRLKMRSDQARQLKDRQRPLKKPRLYPPEELGKDEIL